MTRTSPATGHSALPSGRKRIHPSKPALIIAPLNTALAGVGATGCASGNHTCSGTSPALMPRLTTSSTINTERYGEAATAAGTSANRASGTCSASMENAMNCNTSPSSAMVR
jgi:hypothetical protein